MLNITNHNEAGVSQTQADGPQDPSKLQSGSRLHSKQEASSWTPGKTQPETQGSLLISSQP